MNSNGFEVTGTPARHPSEFVPGEHVASALSEQMANTLAGPTATPSLLFKLYGQALPQDETPGVGSSGRRGARSHVDAMAESVGLAVTRRDVESESEDDERFRHALPGIERFATTLPQPPAGMFPAQHQTDIKPVSRASQSNGRKREGYGPPAEASPESRVVPGSYSPLHVESSSEHSSQQRQGQTRVRAVEGSEGRTRAQRDWEFDAEAVALTATETGATSPAFFEQHTATFATPTLPPLLPHQTGEMPDLPVAVTVTRQGARSEALADGEDLDALAEKIKLILDEQARRHGIDV
jgi:hypothetical protein